MMGENVLYAIFNPLEEKYFYVGKIPDDLNWKSDRKPVNWSDDIKAVYTGLDEIGECLSDKWLFDVEQYQHSGKKACYTQQAVEKWVIVKVHCDPITEEYEADFTDSYIVGEIL